MSVRDRLQRRVIPRLVVALSTVRWPARVAAALRRARGGRARVELFVAFDDPQSAVALLAVHERLAGRHAELVVQAVIARGIPGDPAVDAKRAYAIVDARRLARRGGRVLTRTAPIAATDVAFIAEWTATAPDDATRTAFSIAAIRELWLASDGPISPESYAKLWREHVGGDPPAGGSATAAERAYRRRKLYDTPVAVVHGQWFFAHERLPAIEHRLDELGWSAAA